MGTRLGRIVLLSDDINRACDFYRDHFGFET
ncbi:MAG: VOC family protein, partial [Mycetocola sp.]